MNAARRTGQKKSLVVSALQTSLPQWSQASNPTLGRDPLGLQATSVRIYRDLVPGLTNVTNRLRYYSFYCWVVHNYETSQHADDEKRWKVFIRRAEALYALAAELHDPAGTGGLAGGEWARLYLRENKAGAIDLRRYADKPGDRTAKQYLLASRGNFGQFYVASMIEVGLLQPTTGVPLVSRPRGEELAEAFAAAIGSRAETLIAQTLISGKIDWKDAKAVGQAVHPDSINASTREMRLLRDFLLVNVPDTVNGSSRRSSVWLLLDLLRQGVSLDDEAAIRRAFYHRVLPSNKRYEVNGQTIDRWRVYQANELCHVALEVWLNAISKQLDSYAAGATPTKVIGDLISAAFKARELEGDWKEWATSVGNADFAHEEEITDQVLDALGDLDKAQDRRSLRAAAKLLAILWARWSGGANEVREHLQRYAGVGGRSLAHVLASLDAHAARRAREALTRAIQEHVVEGHLTIAARKLAASDKFTYRFMLSDGILTDGTLTEYGYTNPRLRNLARFLRDSKLAIGDNLTAAGTKFLDENEPA